jgi:hypothetical protein
MTRKVTLEFVTNIYLGPIDQAEARYSVVDNR